MTDRGAAPTMGATEWTAMLVLSVLWRPSFFFYKVLVAQVPPFTVVLGRVALTALLLHLLLVVARDPMPRDPALWGRFVMPGVLNNVVPFSLFAFGETRISSGLASILNATTPLFGVVVAHLFTADERLSWGKAAGVAFGLVGVAVLVGTDALRHAGDGDLLGEAACLDVRIKAGDLLVLPAGTGHRRVGASADFLLVGAYPDGQHWDVRRAAADEADAARIADVPPPANDPIDGAGGPLVQLWRTAK